MAKHISRAVIEATMQEVTRLAFQNPSVLTDQMEAEQPVLRYYLYELDQLPFGLEEEMHLSEAEAGHIFYIGVVLWQALNQQRGPLRPLTWDDIDAATTEVEQPFAGQDDPMHPNLDLLEVETHPEPELARFLKEAIQAWPGDEDFQPIRPEYRPPVLVLLHIVLNALLRGQAD